MSLPANSHFDDALPRDVGAVAALNWPRRELMPVPEGRAAGFQVIVQQSAMDAVHRHGQSLTHIEIGGFLVGNVCCDDCGPFLHITGAIEGRHATHHAAQITFTAATWDYAHQVLEQDYRGQRIVGWYHTHPDFGVFLSGMDLFIQDNFFNLPWQVAMVYDPIRHDEGFFVWKNARSERVAHLVYGGEYADSRSADAGGGDAAMDQRPPAMRLEIDDQPPAQVDLRAGMKKRRRTRWRRLLMALDRFFDEQNRQ